MENRLAAKKSGLECTCSCEQWHHHCTISGDGRHHWVYCVAITFKMNEQVEQHICIKVCIKLEHPSGSYSDDSEGFSYGQLVIGSFVAIMCLLMHHISCIVFWQKHQITQATQPRYSPDLAPSNFWLFPKLKSPLKGKRFQTIDENRENVTGQLVATGGTVWGLKVPALKGTEASLLYIQCFLYLLQ